ncbi:MAG: hypothetical protein ACFFHV_12375 [Promethearchaeota archaeon]
MDYECPECGNQDPPKIVSHFHPPIYQCIVCGKKGDKKDFFKKRDKKAQFTPIPKHPSKTN